MQFGNVIKIESQALTKELVDSMYPIDENAPSDNKDRKQLESIYNLFSSHFDEIDNGFTCFVFDTAINAFVSFANDIYRTTHNEATGLIVGYYLHDPNNPSKKIVVATNFLEATGDSSTVTCEFSYDDSARHSKYCEEHKVLPIIWIHSHPGFGVFYSGTDSTTLRAYFNCSHQLGIVVDNIQNQYLAYKIINGLQTEIDIWGINIQKSIDTGKLDKFIYSNRPTNPKFEVKKKVSFKALQEKNPVQSKVAKPISFGQSNSVFDLDSEDIKTDVEYLKTKVSQLNKLITELYSITENNDSKYIDGIKFSAEDIKEEVSIQINSCLKEVKHLFETLRLLKSKFSIFEDEIAKLKNDINELNQLIRDNQVGSDDKTKELEESVEKLQQEFDAFSSESIINRIIKTPKDRNIIFAFFIALFISLACNIWLCCNESSKPDEKNKTHHTQVTTPSAKQQKNDTVNVEKK